MLWLPSEASIFRAQDPNLPLDFCAVKIFLAALGEPNWVSLDG
jgi:hypothetical protein